MNQRSRITGHTAPTTTPDVNEALRQVITTPTVTTRRLIAAGVKYGNSRLIIQAVTV